MMSKGLRKEIKHNKKLKNGNEQFKSHKYIDILNKQKQKLLCLTREVTPLAALTWGGSMTSRLHILLYHPLLRFLAFAEGDNLVYSNTYSLRSELLVSNMDVSRTKIRLHTSIFATSNSERRE